MDERQPHSGGPPRAFPSPPLSPGSPAGTFCGLCGAVVVGVGGGPGDVDEACPRVGRRRARSRCLCVVEEWRCPPSSSSCPQATVWVGVWCMPGPPRLPASSMSTSAATVPAQQAVFPCRTRPGKPPWPSPSLLSSFLMHAFIMAWTSPTHVFPPTHNHSNHDHQHLQEAQVYRRRCLLRRAQRGTSSLLCSGGRGGGVGRKGVGACPGGHQQQQTRSPASPAAVHSYPLHCLVAAWVGCVLCLRSSSHCVPCHDAPQPIHPTHLPFLPHHPTTITTAAHP